MVRVRLGLAVALTVLTAVVAGAQFADLSPDLVRERAILRDTKKDLPAYFLPASFR